MPRGAPVDGFELAYDTVLWPTQDPLFPVAWSDRPAEFFADAQLQVLDGVGHFVPLQAPETVAAAIRAAMGTSA